MTTIGPTYPAQFVVSQAEVKLIADQTSSAGPCDQVRRAELD
jgi:hypothetical protein